MILLEILAAYLPFQIALNPTQSIDLASIRVFILLIFFFWLAEGLRKKRLNVIGGPVAVFLTMFLFLSCFSLFWAKNEDWAIRKILFFLSIFPLYFVVSDLVRGREKMDKLLGILSYSGMVVAFIGIIQFLSQFVIGLDAVCNFWARYITIPFLGASAGKAVLLNPSWLVNISGHTFLRVTATFPDPHMLSLYLGMLIPVSIGLYISKKKAIYIFSFVLMLLADFLTYSRGGYLGLMVGAIFLILVFWRAMVGKYKLFILSFLVLIALTFIIPGPIADRFHSIFDLKEGSNVGRMDMWKKSARVALNNPLWGVGIGNYPLEIKSTASYREPITAHNTYLDIASETGIINTIIWIVLLASAIMIFIKKSAKDSFFLMLATSIVVFSAHQLAETAIYSPVVLTLFVIILAFTNVREIEKEY